MFVGCSLGTVIYGRASVSECPCKSTQTVVSLKRSRGLLVYSVPMALKTVAAIAPGVISGNVIRRAQGLMTLAQSEHDIS